MRRLIPHWRKMTWVLVIWTAIFAVWIIAGVSSNDSNDRAYCRAHIDHYFTMKDCLSASHAGTAIGAALIFILWFLGFVVLGLVWLMSRPRRRTCPHCGNDVKKGLTACKNCGYDFVAGHSQAARFDPQTGEPLSPNP